MELHESDETNQSHSHARGRGGLVAALLSLAACGGAYLGLKPPSFWNTAIAAIATLCITVTSTGCVLLMRRYTIILRAASLRKGSRDRKPYVALRTELGAGGRPALIYKRWLTEALERADRFFGDDGPDAARCTLWPKAFGLSNPAPLWTPPAFDRCMLLALVYPLAVLFFIWVLTGHSGPAEKALGLSGDLRAWRRYLSVVTLLMYALAFPLAKGASKAKALIILISFYSGGLALLLLSKAISVPFAIAGAFAFPIAGVLARTRVVRDASVGVVTVSFVTGAALGAMGSDAVGEVIGGAVAVGFAIAVAVSQNWAMRRGWQGRFQVIHLVCCLCICLILPSLVSGLHKWAAFSPILLFSGLLTLINAPFDWFSLGLTRALLRRGLERQAWWPYVYAIIDTACAAVVIAILAIAMTLSVQAFNDMAVVGGGNPSLDLRTLLNGISDHPERPEYFWVYATLFSTMTPSLLNLCVAGAALLRGAPPLTRLLLRNMPETGAVERAELVWMPLVLTAQVIGGVALAILSQAVVFLGVIRLLLHVIGFNLVSACLDLVDADLPGQVITLLAGR